MDSKICIFKIELNIKLPVAAAFSVAEARLAPLYFPVPILGPEFIQSRPKFFPPKIFISDPVPARNAQKYGLTVTFSHCFRPFSLACLGAQKKGSILSYIFQFANYLWLTAWLEVSDSTAFQQYMQDYIGHTFYKRKRAHVIFRPEAISSRVANCYIRSLFNPNVSQI